MLPFRTGQVVIAKDFCGRKEELKRLRMYLESCNRVYIQGERRVGKSSLVAETVRRMRGWILVHVDLLGVKSARDVGRRIASAVVSSAKDDALAVKTLRAIASLRPSVDFDPQTGSPSISFGTQGADTPETVELALDLLKGRKKAVLFLDEFQDLLGIRDTEQVIALMRGRIQLMRSVSVVYAGSVRNEMDRMFTDPEAPFYKSAMKIALGPIKQQTVCRFIKDKFADGNRTVGLDVLPGIYEMVRGNPGDMIKLCVGLWEMTSPGDEITVDRISDALELLWGLEEQNYEDRIRELSEQQVMCLRALAVCGITKGNKDFVERTGIVLQQSVGRALKRLAERRVLICESGEYRFSDPFFAAWIRAKGI